MIAMLFAYSMNQQNLVLLKEHQEEEVCDGQCCWRQTLISQLHVQFLLSFVCLMPSCSPLLTLFQFALWLSLSLFTVPSIFPFIDIFYPRRGFRTHTDARSQHLCAVAAPLHTVSTTGGLVGAATYARGRQRSGA
jgi:hypothetical protein